MTKIHKSVLSSEGNSFHVAMPFAKVDEANRLVTGFATLDNIDSQGDVVLAEASQKAFSRARGNIREMHQPIAAGRLVDFREDEYFDPENNELYRGIFVTARVSEGAEDTWKKVLDGTLTGFSIGGEINEASNEFVKEAGKTIRFIKDYDLVELSLVDNPANQLANVFSIQKSATGSVVKGMLAETLIENVFICKNDQTVIVKDTESESCPNCGSGMENAGWFEEGTNRAEKVRDIVTKFLSPADKEVAPNSSEGGVDVGKVIKSEPVPEAKEVSVPNPSEVHPDGEPIEEEAEAAVEVDETAETEEEPEADAPVEVDEDEDTQISKKIDELHVAIKNSLEDVKVETGERVEALEKKIDEATESFLSKTSELESKIGEFSEKIEVHKSSIADLASRLEKFNSSEAIRKSADLEPAEKIVQKEAFWDGAFSNGN
jgi:hypothetical protein